MLNNALKQTGWRDAPLTETTWRNAVKKRLERVDWGRVMNDVRPFLEFGANPDLLRRENLLGLLD